MPIVWNAENAAHLLRRAGVGPRPEEIEKAVANGQAATVQSLFKPWKKKDKFGKKLDDVWLEELQRWWLDRMIRTKSPLEEKTTLLWHNHFATAIHKVEEPRFMHKQNRTLRKHALGSFREMLSAIARDPAMLVWLDNESNVVGNPNENFARELMELFSTGVLDEHGQPNYTEADVQAAARAFTGWTLDWEDAKFVFDDDLHDFGQKTFKGVTGNLGGQDVLDILAVDPATARRVAWRLFSFFAYEVDLSDPVLDPFAQAYLDHDTAIAPVLQALFTSDVFYGAAARRARVKSPMEFLAGALRMLGGKVRKGGDWSYDVHEAIRDLGQSIFDPPSVFGWKEGLPWVSSNGLLQRLRAAARIADARDDEPWKWKPKKLLPKKKQWGGLDAGGVVDLVVARLGPAGLDPATRQTLITYLETDEQGQPAPFALDQETVDRKVRGLVALVLASPEFQFA